MTSKLKLVSAEPKLFGFDHYLLIFLPNECLINAYRFSLISNNILTYMVPVLLHFMDLMKDVYIAIKIYMVILENAGSHTRSIYSLPFGFFMTTVVSVTISQMAILILLLKFSHWLVSLGHHCCYFKNEINSSHLFLHTH